MGDEVTIKDHAEAAADGLPFIGFQPVITPSAWPYLVAQKGRLHKLADNAPAWRAAYAAALVSQFERIRWALPATCASILDVGGGMGGINILLSRFYERDGTGAPRVVILDGDKGTPEVNRHAEPFSDCATAAEFLRANGVELADYITPDEVRPDFGQGVELPRFDLIVSFGAWCFHIEPAVYLDFVERSLAPETGRLIVEVRRTKPGYLETLRERFYTVAQMGGGDKFETFVFARRP